MANSNPHRNPLASGGLVPQKSAKVHAPLSMPRKLSSSSMQMLLEKTREGERNTSRTIISHTLNVNDVVAEYCLRHLEEKLRSEKDYAAKVLAQTETLAQSNPSDVQQFLKTTFGVQGKVSSAILSHMQSKAGA